ncbi:RNA lariat debranching enzyme [Cryptococcus wingfieldii CBS 7118]|uniref:RNA lariat debranching enzyme n=1 Tax=Cryptococcus wingfieldii CBS 7118 TaxID=1295528 RepID=A0A1E3K610_9TREE|nr:RNA lariat debranching enzyme [Cryptococcus wingfieldii CBS 7118]ODO08455.1 RNA lariat debranching enzyme [Cryptococcus wingfieldii CBS 7118]
MRIAIQGCSHGSLAEIYDTVEQYTTTTGNQIDLLLLCGDFQALRSVHDFPSLAVPDKFKQLGTFQQYYSGQRVAPVLTIVIGGNHEASNYMWELYHGGWLAPSIYYMGAAGSVYVNGLRIVGASGIYKSFDYTKGKCHHERVPYDSKSLRTIYHIREYDVEKLMRLTPSPNTIVMSHDWPTTIAHHGDKQALLRRKPFFAEEASTSILLGSPPLLKLMNHFQPAYWFAAHLHVKFAALYQHNFPSHSQDLIAQNQSVHNPDEILIEDEEPLVETGKAGNPDEIKIDDDEDMGDGAKGNPDEIVMDDGEFEDLPATGGGVKERGNPDEILVDDDEFDTPTAAPQGVSQTPAGENPDEIVLDDEIDDPPSPAAPTNDSIPAPAPAAHTAAPVPVPASEPTQPSTTLMEPIDESADLLAAARAKGDGSTATGTIAPSPDDAIAERLRKEAEEEKKRWSELAKNAPGGQGVPGSTKFLALDKCGPNKRHMQFIEIPDLEPNPSYPPRLTYDPEWLAITRALHPYLPLEYHAIRPPPSHILGQMIEDERIRMREEGLLVPQIPKEGEEEGEELVWEKGKIDVGRVQRFWWTAPPQGEPGGSATAWYTNPQTLSFCGMLGLDNKINPAPPVPLAPAR